MSIVVSNVIGRPRQGKMWHEISKTQKVKVTFGGRVLQVDCKVSVPGVAVSLR